MLPRYLLMLMMNQDKTGKPRSIWFTVVIAIFAAIMLVIEIMGTSQK